MTKVSLEIPAGEFAARGAMLSAESERLGAAATLIFDAHWVFYYSRFSFYPTERPVVLILHGGKRHLFVPRLELEHAQAKSIADAVHTYEEYPRHKHPMLLLGELLARLGLAGKPLAADNDGYPWIYGYMGPTLSKVTGSEVIHVAPFINRQMSVKSMGEIALMRECLKWSHYGHTLLQRYTRPGVSEAEVSMRSGMEATLAMRDALGNLFSPQAMGFFNDGVLVLYRGQIGKGSSLPHAMTGTKKFAPGQVLVTGASTPMWGYLSELERTMFLGEPSKDQVQFFNLMLEVQTLAIETIRPGITCAEIDTAVNGFFAKNGLEPYWRHHSGHSLGLRNHEGPFLDVGDETVLEEGMVFAVEPGLYHPGLGGFRHADTVLVTHDGAELMCHYPRDLDSLVISV